MFESSGCHADRCSGQPRGTTASGILLRTNCQGVRSCAILRQKNRAWQLERELLANKFHHDIESADMFPRIRAAGGEKFREIVDKLKAEHEVVHELIIRLSRAADALAETPSEANFDQAATTFRKLEEIVRSHFGYEENELAEAIGYYLGSI